jgi:FixJ family two-component response regulator
MTEGTVHVIDDDLSVRCAIGRLLRSHDQQVRTYPSAREFLSQQFDSRPACVVLDLQMPEMSGLDLQEALTTEHENLSIIFISGHAHIPDSVRAMKAGAVDFLTKPFDESQLLAAVDAALERSNQACARREELERDCAIFETLTPREREVCLRVAQGMLNKQIGGEFGTREKTIKVQRGRVMQKLGAQSITDIVRLVERLRACGHLPPTSSPPGKCA